MHVQLQQLLFHDMYVRTVPRTAVRQIGQSWTVGAHVSQQTKWLHGKNSVEMSLSMQILHSIVSLSRRFSSFRLSISAQAAYQNQKFNQGPGNLYGRESRFCLSFKSRIVKHWLSTQLDDLMPPNCSYIFTNFPGLMS